MIRIDALPYRVALTVALAALIGSQAQAITVTNGDTFVATSDASFGAVPPSFAPADITLDNGTLQFAASFDVNSNRGITINAGGGTIDTQGFSVTAVAALAGSSSTTVLNKTGSGTMRFNSGAAASSYSGIVNVNAGTLQLNGGTAMGDLASINLANTAGTTLSISGTPETIGSLSGGGLAGGNVALTAGLTIGANNASTVFTGSITGSGGFAKVGTGKTTLNGNHAFAGGTTIGGGTLEINGSLTGSAVVLSGGTMSGIGAIGGTTTVFAGGHLSPGTTVGKMGMNGLAMQDGAFLHADIGFTSDQVNVATNLAVNGTLDVQIAPGFFPSVGTTFTVMTAAAVSGTFSTEAMPTFMFRTFDVIYNSQTIDLKVVPVLPGDFNTNGKVDGADYVTWRNNLGTIFTPADYGVWRANFGNSAGSGLSVSAVPEPASWLTAATAISALLANFGRMRKSARS